MKSIRDKIKYTILNTIGNNNYKKFVLLSRGRSGSTLLMTFLNSHPNIRCKGEIFARLNGDHWKKKFDLAFSNQFPKTKAYGFKLFYYHPQDSPMGIWDIECGLWKALLSMQDLYIIHLKRNNYLRIVLSAKIAHATDTWMITQKKRGEKLPIVSLDVEELTKEFDSMEMFQELGSEIFNKHPLLEVEYEKLIDNSVSEFKRISEFLGLPYREPQSILKKQSKGTLRESIENYDEIAYAFKETKWSKFFED